MRWFVTDRPFISGVTLINSREYSQDKISEYTVGELPTWAAKRDYNGAWSIPKLKFKDHICHAEWFPTGEPWPVPSSLPPTVYLAGWIPECCVMACAEQDCKADPVNGQPASRALQYAIDAKDATDTTPAVVQLVANALDTTGGNWPGMVDGYYPGGWLTSPVWSNTVLVDPALVPYSRVDQFAIGANNSFTLRQSEGSELREYVLDGVSGELEVKKFGSVVQLTGDNVTIAPSILPTALVYYGASTLDALYYRSAGNQFLPATVGTGLSFAAGVLSATASPPTPQAANSVYAGPTAGAPATPTFRSLVIADVPAAGTTGQVQFSNGTNPASSSALTFTTGTGLLYVNGPLQLDGTGQINFVTPVGSTVPTKLLVPLFNPGAAGQIVALGVPVGSATNSRAITLFDARSVAHQPTILVLSPNEAQGIGLSWDGGNTFGKLKSSAGLVLSVNGLISTTDVLACDSTSSRPVGLWNFAFSTVSNFPVAGIVGLATVATSGSASDLGTGTLPAARLPAVVQQNTTGALTATGTTQGAAAPIVATFSRVTTSAGNQAVRLPALDGPFMVWNSTATTLLVFPQSGAHIGGLATDFALSIATGEVWQFWRSSSTQYAVTQWANMS